MFRTQRKPKHIASQASGDATLFDQVYNKRPGPAQTRKKIKVTRDTRVQKAPTNVRLRGALDTKSQEL